MSNIITVTTNLPIANNAGVRRYNQLRLIKHTAWQIIQNGVPKEHLSATQDKRNHEAVVMLSLVASAYKFCDELITELEEAGLYRHAIKRSANQVEPILRGALNNATTILKRVNNGKTNEGYYDCMDAFYEAIDNCVSLQPPERIYNILLSICRLVARYDAKLTEYHHLRQHEATKVVRVLQDMPIHDYKMDNIIDLTVRPIVFNREY